MKVSEVIEELEVGETVWVKARVDRINNEGKYIKVRPNVSSVYLDGHDEISLTEPTPLDALAQEYDVEPETIREWLDRGHKGSFEKVVVPESLDEYLNWCESYKWITENIVKIENVEYFENHSESTGLTQWVKDNYSIFLIAVSTGEYTIRPKRWVVKAGDYHSTYVDSLTITSEKSRHTISGKEKAHYFTDKSKAEAVAVLVEGSVEEID